MPRAAAAPERHSGGRRQCQLQGWPASMRGSNLDAVTCASAAITGTQEAGSLLGLSLASSGCPKAMSWLGVNGHASKCVLEEM